MSILGEEKAPTPLAKLMQAAARIHAITVGTYSSEIEHARKLPADAALAMDRAKISAGDYLSDSQRETVRLYALDMKEGFIARAVADAEILRDQRLATMAAELESLRAIIPGLAAQVAIEAGKVARALKTEACDGLL